MTDTGQKSHADIDDSITLRQERSGFQAAIRTQPFWVFVAILAIGVVMSFVSDVFLSERNFFNITRNFAFFGIMALGMSAVIRTAGIDLSVGSLMGLTGIVAGLVMQAGYGIVWGFLACMGAAAANHNERLKGARDTLAGQDMGTPPGNPLNGEGGWTEIAGCPLITNDDGNVAVQGMTDILAANPDLTAFLSTGAFTQWFDNAYRQAAEPYKAKMDAGELTIVVADTLPMQLEQTRDGLGNGLVGQRPFEMGYKAMYILKDIVEGKPVDDPIYTGLDVCDNSNIDTCVQ
jgi:ABC-type sugar transport system substrate-binding protein